MADGTLKVGTITTSSGSGTITLGQSGETLALGSGVASKFNQPAFEAYLSSNQTITNNTLVKAQIDTEIFDTDNCYDSSTNYRFTPTVAGKYYVYASSLLTTDSTQLQAANVSIYKNGSSTSIKVADYRANPITEQNIDAFNIIDLNGTSDYVEFYVKIYKTGGTAIRATAGTKATYFGAYRIGA